MALTARYVSDSGSATYAASVDPAQPMSLTTAFANMAAGDEIWIKKGNYTARTSDTPLPDGGSASPIVLHGYNSVITDLDVPAYNLDGSLITTNYPVIEYNQAARLVASGSNLIVYRNLKVGIAGSGFSGAGWALGASCVVHQCYVYNPSTNAAAECLSVGASGCIVNCDFALTGASGGNAAVNCTSASARVVGCRIIDSQSVGITSNSNALLVMNNIFFAAVVGPCIEYTATAATTCTIIGNTCQGKAIGFRCEAVTYTVLHYFADNHFTDMSTAGFLSLQDGTSQNPGCFISNRFRDNIINIDGWDDWAAATSFNHITTDTGGPETDYIDISTDQYTLIAGAPGAGAATIRNRDIGALQRAYNSAKGRISNISKIIFPS